MKIVAILVILCSSAHRNNSNYIPLLIALYLYPDGARVDAVTLLNHLGIPVPYDVFQKKLPDTTNSAPPWTKAQGPVATLVGSCDNFEFRENVHGERTGDTVKFRSITLALRIRQGWRMPDIGLKQCMWNPKRALLESYLIEKVFLTMLG